MIPGVTHTCMVCICIRVCCMVCKKKSIHIWCMHMYALKHTCMQMYAYMYAFFTRTLPVARVVLGCLPVLPGMTAVPGLSIQQEARRRACGPITISHDHAHRIDCQPWGFGGRSHHGQPREPQRQASWRSSWWKGRGYVRERSYSPIFTRSWSYRDFTRTCKSVCILYAFYPKLELYRDFYP